VAYILSLETATDTCSVALSQKASVIAEEHISEGMRHSSALTSLIQKVLASAGLPSKDLAAVAISEGPGSYTGLRVGASTAKAICFAHDIPLIAISTLEGIAHQYSQDEIPILATLDARRMEVYGSFFQNKKEIEAVQSIIWDEVYVKELVTKYPQVMIIGTGVEKAKDLFDSYSTVRYQEIECRASYLTAPAWGKYQEKDFADIAYHSPNYFKRPNITVAKSKI